ncbi:energy transducer TonB [Flavobacterium sp.]|uniref:energy transducer TonB n=1 Tax=Flavobacterium sp. TaxID=239 RepID=UPI00261584E2|nr:energy transducer TonB [Flavobacterium sp.]
MKRLFLLLLLTSFSSFSQRNADKIIYTDSIGRVTTEEDAAKYQIVRDYYVDKDEYTFQYYYKSGQLQRQGNSIDKEVLRATGVFTEFYENGNKKSVVNYRKPKSITEVSLAIGSYNSWYENGNRKEEGEYIEKQNEGRTVSVLKINQFWNLGGKQTAVNGNGDYEDEQDGCLLSGKLKNGFKDGQWTGSNDKYKFTFWEKYENGNLIEGESTDKNNEKHPYTKLYIMAEPKDGMKGFYQYIMKNFHVPEGQNINGSVIVNFKVNEDSSLTNLVILRSLGSNVDAEALRIVAGYREMQPPLLRGIKVSANFSLPIKIVASE